MSLTHLLHHSLAGTLAQIVPRLLKVDNYAVETLEPLRPPADMLRCFINARRVTPMWRVTPNGSAYQLQASEVT
jgi:hypothetical protein